MLSQDRADKIDALLAPWAAPGQPGCALALMRGAEMIYQRCVGLANIEHGVPIRPETRFHIASITKTFVGAAAVLLHRRGKLSIDADVRAYVPELTLPASLTLRQMLNMISGLRDSMESMVLRGVWFRYPRSNQDLLDLAYAQRSLCWPSGQRYVYTNINFNLLALVIERVSGRPFVDVIAENIWKPLGMGATLLREANTVIVPGLADAYVPHNGGLDKGTWAFGLSGAGGFVSNLPDLLRWQGMFRSGAIAGEPVVDMMSERGKLTDGRRVNYGLGLGVRRHRGVTVLCHGGALPGYRAMFCRVPERDFGFVLLCNRDDADPYLRMQQILDIALDGELPEPGLVEGARKRLGAVTVPAAVLDGLGGRYLDAKSSEPLDVTFDRATATINADKLGYALALRPSGPDTFADTWPNVDTELRIEALADGGARLHLDFGGQTGVFERLHPYQPAPGALADAVGSYWAEDLKAPAEVMLRTGKLVLRFGHAFHGDAEMELAPLSPDQFLIARDDSGFKKRYAVRFQRAGKNVLGISISSDRLKDTWFARV